MSATTRPPIPAPELRRLVALLALITLASIGCRRPEPSLGLHYLPGFVAGTRNVFAAATVAIAPPGGTARQSRREVGAVFDPAGRIERRLYVEDFAKTLTGALSKGLTDAGLRAIALESTPPDLRPPKGADFLLLTAIAELRVDKRFGEQATVHGRYFTMHSSVKLRIELNDSGGRRLLVREIEGAEDEPPAPVGGEVFLPLETAPGESLSVAMSRAVGAIVLDPAMRRALPRR